MFCMIFIGFLDILFSVFAVFTEKMAKHKLNDIRIMALLMSYLPVSLSNNGGFVFLVNESLGQVWNQNIMESSFR